MTSIEDRLVTRDRRAGAPDYHKARFTGWSQTALFIEPKISHMSQQEIYGSFAANV